MYIACNAFVRGGWRWGGGGATFLQGALSQKFQLPLGILGEKILNFLGAVCARMCGGGRERENRNSAALIGMWVDAGGGRLHM